jgi:hypothetical protein
MGNLFVAVIHGIERIGNGIQCDRCPSERFGFVRSVLRGDRACILILYLRAPQERISSGRDGYIGNAEEWSCDHGGCIPIESTI